MLPRAAVDIGVTPGVQWNVLFQVRAVPTFDIWRLDLESLQSFFSRWIAANVQTKEIEGAFERRHLGLSSGLLGLVHFAEYALSNQCCEKRNDDHDHQ